MDFYHPKLITFLLALAVYLWEWKNGRFREFGVRIRNIKTGFYLSVAALFILPSAGLFFVDPVLLRHVHNLHSPVFNAISEWGGRLGRETNPWLLMMAGYIFALLLRRIAWVTVSFGTILSSTLASILCNISKYVFLRARPNANEGPFSFFNFEAFSGGGGTYYSFPSGDVVVVAGAAYFLMLRAKNKILRTILFLLPVTTAFARMDANKHWPSDVVLSLGWGLVCALFVRALTSSQTKKVKA